MATQRTTDLYELADAIVRKIQGKSEANDEAIINAWLASDPKNEQIYADILKDGGTKRLMELQEFHKGTEAALQRFHARVKTNHRNRWIKIAAVAIGLVFASVLIQQQFINRSGGVAEQHEMLTPNDILPASTKAELILADGSRVALTERGDTTFAHGSAQIKQSDGRLRYIDKENVAVVQQELVTPNAGTYSMVLPDGTTVWLNAASSLKFPNRFAGNQRIVELNGEGYFEVAKDAQKPFTVVVNGGSKVQVLGTVFNIRGYKKEQVRTTLIEGSVKVIDATDSSILKPGQMAEVGVNGVKTSIGNIATATAWRNNQFLFQNTTVVEMMEEISRWYDIKLVYEKDYQQQAEPYTGRTERNIPLNNFLKMLEQTEVGRFKLQGRTLYISAFK